MSDVKRNYGIELLRILSMLMIIVLHICGRGGLLENVSFFSIRYFVVWFLESFCYIAVNCYALISGYVGVNSKPRSKRIVVLWLEVVFYTIGIALVFSYLFSDLVNKAAWLSALFPVLKGHYWYISCYFVLFIFMPILNNIIIKVDRDVLKRFILGVLILSFLICVISGDPGRFMRGYSTIWLMVLYLVGGYISKYNVSDEVKRKQVLSLFIFSFLVTYLGKIVLGGVLGSLRYGGMFLMFDSVSVFISSVCFFILFLNIRMNTNIIKIVKPLSRSSLAVYLIHTNQLVWIKFFNLFLFLLKYNALVMGVLVVGIAICIYVVCFVIDFIRIKLFDLLRVDRVATLVGKWMDKGEEFLLKYIW